MQSSELDSPESALASRIVGDVREVCGEGSAIEHIGDVAHAVASFLARQGDIPVSGSRKALPLVLRALLSIGSHRNARKLVLLRAGIVYPSVWHSVNEAAMWVLDVKRLALSDGPDLEIAWFDSLGMTLDAIADVWDESLGRGVLGLKHLRATAAMFLGCPRKSQRVVSLVNEIKTLCSFRLERLRCVRGWMESPHVISLDA